MAGSSSTPVSFASCHTCFVAGPAASIDPVPTSKICTRCGAWSARQAAIAAGERVGVTTLENGLNLRLGLAVVERLREAIGLVGIGPGHRVPQHNRDLAGLTGGRPDAANGAAAVAARRVRRFMSGSLGWFVDLA